MEPVGICKVLSEDVQNSVRTGLTISTMAQVVEELVLNSVDAQAKTIFIGVSYNTFSLQVDDDGVGVCKTDLAMIGTRYATSKCRTVEDLKALRYYGYRGEALASIIRSSLGVKITTTTTVDRVVRSYCKKWKTGKPEGGIERFREWKKKTSGFMINVDNILAAMPVRRWYKTAKALDMEEIKKVLQRICLINPDITVDCRDFDENDIILNYRGAGTFQEAFSSLFEKGFNIIEECHLYESYFFTAFIAKELHSSSNYQFVFVNKRYVGKGKVYRKISSQLIKMLPKTKNTSSKKHPIFMVNIKCPLNLYDVTSEPKKAKSEVVFQDFEALSKGLDGLMLAFQSTLNSLSGYTFSFDKKKLTANGAKKQKPATVTSGNSKSLPNDSLNTSSIGHNVTTHDVKGAVHSRFATREDTKDTVAEKDIFRMETNQLPSTQTSGTISQEDPIMSLKKTQPMKRKIETVVTNLKTSGRVVPSSKSGDKVNNIVAGTWNPRKLAVAAKPKSGINKPIFSKFPQWDEETKEVPSSEESCYEVPAKTTKPNEYNPPATKHESVSASKSRLVAESEVKESKMSLKNLDELALDAECTVNWKIERFLQDCEIMLSKRRNASGTLSEPASQGQVGAGLSIVESNSSSRPKFATNLPKKISSPLKKKIISPDPDGVRDVRTMYLSQSPETPLSKTNEVENLNRSVEIIDVTPNTTSEGDTFYIKLTQDVCKELDEQFVLSGEEPVSDFFKNPLVDSFAQMKQTETGKLIMNSIQIRISDATDGQGRAPTDGTGEFRVRAPDVEVEDGEIIELE